MEAKFHHGDVVLLKSGTVPMTVISTSISNLNGQKLCVCAWDGPFGERHVNEYPEGALREAEKYVVEESEPERDPTDGPRFKLGDVVQLKSGGPLMTVWSYDETRNEYLCAWFLSNGELGKDDIPAELLRCASAPNMAPGKLFY